MKNRGIIISSKVIGGISAIVNFIAFGTGLIFVWTSPFLPKFQSSDPSINPISRPVTTSEAGLLMSIINFGLLIGPIIPALIAKRFGKRITLLLSATPLLVAHIICSFAKTIDVFLCARVLMGVTTGAIMAIIPGYIGEISEPKNRGLLSSLLSAMGSAGALFGYCTGPFLSMKWFSILNTFPIIVFLLFLFFFVPESPYDLIKVNNFKRAEHTLIMLRNQSDVSGELSQIKESIETDNKSKGKFIDLFKSTSLKKSMLICVGAMAINACSGIAAVVGYTEPIFDLAGSSIPSSYSAIIVGCTALISTIVHANLVDRLGRKILITMSCGIMCLSLLALGSFFYLQENYFNVNSLGWLPLCSIVSYMIGFYLGIAAIPYIMLGELFSSNIKALAAAFCTSLCFTLTFIVTLVFPYLIDSIGTAFTFWLFAIFLALGFVFCLALIPETKDKSLQEISDMLNNFTKE